MSYDFDPYTILDINQNASTETIKHAYEALTQRLHPSHNPNYESAGKQFQTVSMAYNVLMDPIHRRRYDEEAAKRLEEQRLNMAYFTMRVTPSKRTIVPLPEEQVIYLLATLDTPLESDESIKEKANPLNLTLVLDHSNSMGDEDRLKRVQAAAIRIIEEMEEDDIISVVAFNDRPTTTIPAQRVTDKNALRWLISRIQPRGGTEIFQGLKAGYEELQKHLSPQRANHIILLTDGHTARDEQQCYALAREAADEGISISAMGLGSDWNDTFLDQLASSTGGVSTYIRSVNMVSEFMDERVRNLSNAFAERVHLSVAPDPDVHLEMAFKLSPHPQPLPHENGIIPLSSLQAKRPIRVLLQFQLPANMREGYRSVARLVASGDLMRQNARPYQTVSNLTIEVSRETTTTDTPPPAIVDALSKWTVYRQQEKAEEAVAQGDIAEATRRLEYLATNLLRMGEVDLAYQAQAEAQNLTSGGSPDKARKKTIKYSTRALINPDGMKDGIDTLMTRTYDD